MMSEEKVEIKDKSTITPALINKKKATKNLINASEIPYYDLKTLDGEISKKVTLGKMSIVVKKNKLRYKEMNVLLKEGYKVYETTLGFYKKMFNFCGIMGNDIKISWK
jgi:hypothetical protein